MRFSSSQRRVCEEERERAIAVIFKMKKRRILNCQCLVFLGIPLKNACLRNDDLMGFFKTQPSSVEKKKQIHALILKLCYKEYILLRDQRIVIYSHGAFL